MKVIYKLEIELRSWEGFRCLVLETDSKFKAERRETLFQLTETHTQHARSFLYNILTDEYLVSFWPYRVESEEAAHQVLSEFVRCGWEVAASLVDGAWVYNGKRWYIPNSLGWPGPHGKGAQDALEETLRQDEKTAGEEDHRPPGEVAQAGERSEAETGGSGE